MYFCGAQNRHGYASGAATMGTSGRIKNKVSWAPARVRMTLGAACIPAAYTSPLDLTPSRSTASACSSLYRNPTLSRNPYCAQHPLSSLPTCSPRSARPTATLHQPKRCLSLLQPSDGGLRKLCLRAMHRQSDYLDVSQLSTSTNITPLKQRLYPVHCRVGQEH